MIKHSINLFPTYVVVYHDFLDQSQVKNIFDYCINDVHNHQTHGACIGDGSSSFTPYFSKDFLGDIQNKIKACANIKNDIEKLFNEYCDETGIENVKISNSWYNIQQKDSLLMNHFHPSSTLSAALYINVDKDSSPLFFENPNPYLFAIRPNRNRESFYSECFTVKPDIGTLIVFPSWLKHGSYNIPNQTSNRVVVSVNSTS